MAANYPSSADDSSTLPNPSGGNYQNSPDHASLHGNANDAIKAIEAKLGTGASTPTNNTFLIGNGVGTSAWSALTSAQLASRISDETGSGSLVFANTPTLTTPKVNTINEETAANGVTIDGLNLKDGKLNTNDSVVEANYTDGSIKPEHLVASTGTTWVWQSWVPTFTNMSGGTLDYAKYHQAGKIVYFRWKYTLAGAGIAGGVSFTLPVAMNSDYHTTETALPGVVAMADTGTAQYIGIMRVGSSTTIDIRAQNASGTYLAANGISSSIPHVWAATDFIAVSGHYEAA